MAAGTSSTIRGSAKCVAPFPSAEKGWGEVFGGLRRWRLRGSCPETVAAPSAAIIPNYRRKPCSQWGWRDGGRLAGRVAS